MRYYSTFVTLAMLGLHVLTATAQQEYLDNTFGTNGIATAEHFEPNAMMLQQDGK